MLAGDKVGAAYGVDVGSLGVQPKGHQAPPTSGAVAVAGKTKVNGYLYKGGNPKDPKSWVQE